MGMGMYITRKILGRVNSRHSVRVPEYVYMLETQMVSFPMLVLKCVRQLPSSRFVLQRVSVPPVPLASRFLLRLFFKSRNIAP